MKIIALWFFSGPISSYYRTLVARLICTFKVEVVLQFFLFIFLIYITCIQQYLLPRYRVARTRPEESARFVGRRYYRESPPGKLSPVNWVFVNLKL